MSGGNVTIEGQAEVQKALEKVADFDKEAAATDAASRLLPSVRAGTRVKTGLLASAWEAEEGAFVNEVPYASFQEFGTETIVGSLATIQAFNDRESDVLEAFNKGIEDAARQAGFDPK